MNALTHFHQAVVDAVDSLKENQEFLDSYGKVYIFLIMSNNMIASKINNPKRNERRQKRSPKISFVRKRPLAVIRKTHWEF